MNVLFHPEDEGLDVARTNDGFIARWHRPTFQYSSLLSSSSFRISELKQPIYCEVVLNSVRDAVAVGIAKKNFVLKDKLPGRRCNALYDANMCRMGG
jgi:hypothetical protein